MNIKQAAQVIRDTVSMDHVLALYGYRTKHGFMCCPFHGEKAPSLKVYNGTKGWHCFGCGRGGSAIDFVMEHENCNFGTAVRALNDALNLGLMDPHENPEDARKRQNFQLILDRFVDAANSLIDLKIRIVEQEQTAKWKQYQAIRSKETQEITAKEWDVIHQYADEDDYDNYRKERLEKIKEEVAAWRRTARRTG